MKFLLVYFCFIFSLASVADSHSIANEEVVRLVLESKMRTIRSLSIQGNFKEAFHLAELTINRIKSEYSITLPPMADLHLRISSNIKKDREFDTGVYRLKLRHMFRAYDYLLFAKENVTLRQGLSNDIEYFFYTNNDQVYPGYSIKYFEIAMKEVSKKIVEDIVWTAVV